MGNSNGRYQVAIVGATGLVGREFINVLLERGFPFNSLKLLATARSAGRQLAVADQEVPVEETTPASFQGIDLAFISATTEASRHWAPIAVEAGAVVIDDSSAWRMHPDVPLVVPEVNAEDVHGHRGILAIPNCSTTPLVMVLAALRRVSQVRRVIADTYQSVSGTGTAAVAELRQQTRLALEGKELVPHVYPHQIAFNLLPQIDVFLDSGYTKEEWKMVQETHKIMHDESIAISATCVRVPVAISHSLAVHIELARPMTADEVREVLAAAPGVAVLDEPAVNLYPMPVAAAGRDEVFVGRIRQDSSHPNGIAMWIVSDNLRKGAALNAIQIAEELITRGLL